MKAKRKGDEGTVMVSFIIYADGQVKGIKVSRSSGSNLLDQAAMNTVRKVSRRLPFPVGINRKQWQFTLPLVYHLR